MAYVDGFVVPVPKKRLAEYKKLARKAGKIWMEHGALQYVEAVGDGLRKGKVTSFPRSVKLKSDEVVVFAYAVYKVARAPRQGHGQGDGRPAPPARGHGRHAVRRDADVLGRVQADRGAVIPSPPSQEGEA